MSTKIKTFKPNSIYMMIWDVMILIITFLILFAGTIEIAFNLSLENPYYNSKDNFVLQILTFIIFILVVLINFNTGKISY